MESRKFGKSRNYNAASLDASSLVAFRQSFEIIAKWADALKLGHVLRFSLRVAFYVTLLPLTACLIVLGNLFEKLLKRWHVQLDDVRRTGHGHGGWLSAVIFSAYEDRLSLWEELDNMCTTVHDMDLKGMAMTCTDMLSNSLALPRFLGEMASQKFSSQVDSKLLKLRKSTSPYHPSSYCFAFRSVTPNTFWSILGQSFQCKLVMQEDVKVLVKTADEVSKYVDKFLTVVGAIRVVPLTLRALRDVVSNLMEQRVRYPLFKCRPSATSDKSVAFSDMIPHDLLDQLTEKSKSCPEEIASSCIISGFRSYMQMMTGCIPDDMPALWLSSSLDDDCGARIKLPLNSAHDMLPKLEQRLVKTKQQLAYNVAMWSAFDQFLPLLLIKFLRRWYYGKVPITFRNIYVSDKCNSMSATMVRAVYQWTPLTHGSLLSFTIVHTGKGVSITVLSEKRSIQSATLLAECITKAVNNLCISLSIQWDRRSPPSTPTNL